MQIIRRAILSLALIAGITPAIAQIPPPVPALPDTERRTSYSITSSTCACAVGFQLYGDSTDYANWLEVFVNGTMIPQTGNWSIFSPTGSLATIPRPITDAVLTFTQAQTGTVQIVGARRPRRTSQFNEGGGVPTRNFNVVLSDIIAQNRETWDKINDVTGRAVLAAPGETLALLPKASARANQGACFDANGNLTSCVGIPSSSLSAGNGIVLSGVGPTSISVNLQAGPGITISGANPPVISAPPSAITYTPPWTGSTAYLQSKFNSNVVYMTDFMGTTTCDGTIFNAKTASGSPTLSSVGMVQGSLAIGQLVGGPGIPQGTTITGGSGATWTMSANATVTTSAGLVSFYQSGTNQFASMQAFLNAVALNGQNGGTIEGVYAKGNCFVSNSGTTSPTFNFLPSNFVQQYHLTGYGTTIAPDPSAAINALNINDTRGFPRVGNATFADSLSGVTIEGATIYLRNNANANFGIQSNFSNTVVLRNQIFGGDDSCSAPASFTPQHNKTTLVGIGLQPINEAMAEASGAPIRNTIEGNSIKGLGSPNLTPSCAFPVAIQMTGQTNATRIINNNISETNIGVLALNGCSNTAGSPSGHPFLDCISSANGVLVSGNYFEAMNTGILFATTIPSNYAPAQWTTNNNRIENICLSYMDLTAVTAVSAFPFFIGPDMMISGCGSPKYLLNPNAISVDKMTTTPITTSLTTYP